MQAVEERAEQVQARAENVSKSASADSPQQQAAAEVGQTVTDAAPEEDLGDTLSVLQGADSKLEGQDQPQVPGPLCFYVMHSLAWTLQGLLAQASYWEGSLSCQMYSGAAYAISGAFHATNQGGCCGARTYS